MAVSGSQPVRTSARGIDAGHFLELLLPLVRELRERVAPEGEPPVAVAVGAAGMATLGDDLRATLPGALAAQGMTGPLALAADAVTAYTGALGVRPGAVVAVGTGMIALGTDLRDWRRADGWGHLLGDSGGGAWLGRAGLEAAYRAFDGRAGVRRRCWRRPRSGSGRCRGFRPSSTPGRTGRRCWPRSRRTWPGARARATRRRRPC